MSRLVMLACVISMAGLFSAMAFTARPSVNAMTSMRMMNRGSGYRSSSSSSKIFQQEEKSAFEKERDEGQFVEFEVR
jgi:hypothetical protein